MYWLNHRVVPGVTEGSRQPLLVTPVSSGDKARATVEGRKKRLSLKISYSYQHVNSSYSQQRLFHTTLILRQFAFSKCISGDLWPILCWCAVKSSKTDILLTPSIYWTSCYAEYRLADVARSQCTAYVKTSLHYINRLVQLSRKQIAQSKAKQTDHN